MSEAAPPRSPPSQPPRLLFASHLLIPLKVSRSDHPTSPAMRRSWHHRRLAALAHDQLPKKHIATSTAVQRRSVNQGNAVNTTCKLLRGPPSTGRPKQTTQSRSQHRSRRTERLPATRDEISEQLYFAVWLLQGKREKKRGELGVSEAGGSQSARPSLGAVAAFWGSLRGLGLVAGTGVHCRGC